MSGARPTPSSSAATLELDTFRVALGLAIVTGGLALVAPYLNALTAALVALAVAGWAAGLGRDHAMDLPGALSARAVGLLSLAIGIGSFFLLPNPLALARGLVLALAVLPMWWIDHRPVPRRFLRVDGAL